jgi:hypothetical protein
MNYADLVQAITDYTENLETSFVSQIPHFVEQAEERIYRSVMIPELRKNVTASMSAGNQYLARPSDFLAVFSIAVIDGDGDYTYLLDKDVNFIREAFPRSSTQGLPQFYGQFDGDDTVGSGNFILGPTPDASYSVLSCITTSTLRPSSPLAHRGSVTMRRLHSCMALCLRPILT